MTPDFVVDKKTLADNIRTNFKNRIKPDEDSMVYQTKFLDIESENARTYFSAIVWGQLSHDDMIVHCSDLWLLSPNAYCYFIPAFLIDSLDFLNADIVGDTTAYTLTPPPLGLNDSVRFPLRIEPLSDIERQVIAKFFAHLNKYFGGEFLDHLPANALEQFWSRYL